MYAASPWCGTKLNCISWQLCQKCELVRRDVTKSKDGMRLRLYWTFFAKKKEIILELHCAKKKTSGIEDQTGRSGCLSSVPCLCLACIV
jgi:hypothetical protein